MPVRILFSSDLHKRDIDFTSIVGYTQAINTIQDDILTFIKEEMIDIFVSAGDWYDKGYREQGATHNDLNYDRAIAESVNNEAYICLGNHRLIDREQNPEMYIIQPNERYKPLKPIFATTPIFKAVDYIIIGTVQISFFHFDKDNKNYVAERKPGITYHVGVYHDDSVIPSNIRERAGYGGSTSSAYLECIYSNVDLAIIGHIHTKIGVERLKLNSGKTIPLIIPGALAITSNDERVKHKSIQLPVLTINDDNTVSCKLYPFSTHLEMLKFYKKAEPVIRSAAPTEAERSMQIVVKTSKSLVDYLSKKGYDKRYTKLLNNLSTTDLNLVEVMNILEEDPDERESIGSIED